MHVPSYDTLLYFNKLHGYDRRAVRKQGNRGAGGKRLGLDIVSVRNYLDLISELSVDLDVTPAPPTTLYFKQLVSIKLSAIGQGQ
ncbi:MAG: hypothetical protein F6K55_12090 [Moorea sp. SIO4A3]|nr:hypothetical protein [Moorena sp. SIO4A3]